MGKIFKRRNRRPLDVHKGSVRRTPNFYPQFYGDGGEMALQVIDGLERLAGAGMQVANSFDDGGGMTVRTSFRKDAEGNYKTAEVGGADVAGSAVAAMQGIGQLVKGASDLADIADTSSIEDAIDEENAKNFDEATDNESLLALYGNTGRLRTDYTFGDVRGMSKGEKALGIADNMASGMMSGAETGSMAGPYGMAIGAGVGLLSGLGSGLIGSAIGDAKARRQAEHLNAQAEAANKHALNAFDSANQSLSDKNWRSNLVNLSAYGGQIGQDADGMTFLHDFPATGSYAHGGGIHINPANRGKFTEAASRAGMGTQEYARHVLANSGDYDATTVRRANFARNAAKWHHGYGGVLDAPVGYVEGYDYPQYGCGGAVKFGGGDNSFSINGVPLGGKARWQDILGGVLNGVSYRAYSPSVQGYDVRRRVAEKINPAYSNRTGVNFSLSDGFKIKAVNPGTGFRAVMGQLNHQQPFVLGRQAVSSTPVGAEGLPVVLPSGNSQPWMRADYIGVDVPALTSRVGPYSVPVNESLMPYLAWNGAPRPTFNETFSFMP